MTTLYRLETRFTATPGQGDALANILLEAAHLLEPNADCLVYLIARAPEDTDVIFVTEVWTNKATHDESLQDERVGEIIQRARPLIAGVGQAEMESLGGKPL